MYDDDCLKGLLGSCHFANNIFEILNISFHLKSMGTSKSVWGQKMHEDIVRQLNSFRAPVNLRVWGVKF